MIITAYLAVIWTCFVVSSEGRWANGGVRLVVLEQNVLPGQCRENWENRQRYLCASVVKYYHSCRMNM